MRILAAIGAVLLLPTGGPAAAGDAVTSQSYLTHIGRDSVVTWTNKGNGPDRWAPRVLYVWWEDGSGGVMIERGQKLVKRCGPPDVTRKVTCLPVEKP